MAAPILPPVAEARGSELVASTHSSSSCRSCRSWRRNRTTRQSHNADGTTAACMARRVTASPLMRGFLMCTKEPPIAKYVCMPPFANDTASSPGGGPCTCIARNLVSQTHRSAVAVAAELYTHTMIVPVDPVHVCACSCVCASGNTPELHPCTMGTVTTSRRSFL